MLSGFLDKLYAAAEKVPLDTLVWIIWGTFAGLFALSVALSLALPRVRSASKRPFLCLVNAYSALTLAAFLTESGLAQSLFAAVLFWCAGYLLYGVLCFISRRRVAARPPVPQTVTATPVQPPKYVRPEVPAAKSSVRLEHAVSVTDKLLAKNLGKSDRQELEKLKTTLSVLQTKGTLSADEAEILNENFNALLKLMAKYNV